MLEGSHILCLQKLRIISVLRSFFARKKSITDLPVKIKSLPKVFIHKDLHKDLSGFALFLHNRISFVFVCVFDFPIIFLLQYSAIAALCARIFMAAHINAQVSL